jgi:hypothetical protein
MTSQNEGEPRQDIPEQPAAPPLYDPFEVLRRLDPVSREAITPFDDDRLARILELDPRKRNFVQRFIDLFHKKAK